MLLNWTTSYFASDTSLILLPGNHSLSSNLTITNISSLSLLARATLATETRVLCSPGVSFRFQYIDEVIVNGLVLFGCMSTITSVGQFTLEECKIESNSAGSALELKVVDSANIQRSFFHMNDPGGNYTAGGAVFIAESNLSIANTYFDKNFASSGGSVFALKSSVSIHNSTLTNNAAAYKAGQTYLWVSRC